MREKGVAMVIRGVFTIHFLAILILHSRGSFSAVSLHSIPQIE